MVIPTRAGLKRREGAPLAPAWSGLALEDLLAGCGRRQPAALEALYSRTAAQLLGIIVRIIGNRAHAEDVLQEVFISIWQRSDQYERDKGGAMGWIVAIARHRAIDLQRSLRPSMPLEAAELADAEALQVSGPAEHAEFGAARQALQRCLQRLSEAQRQCVVLAYRRGLTQERIAAALDLPLGSVKSWLRRGLLSLRGCLES